MLPLIQFLLISGGVGIFITLVYYGSMYYYTRDVYNSNTEYLLHDSDSV